MSERPIYRPNKLTPEQWDRVSQEEQIQWWKDLMPERRSRALGPMGVLKLHRKGYITALELISAILGRLTEENIREFLSACPGEILSQLRRTVEKLPSDADEEGWGQLIRIDGALSWPWVTQEEIEQAKKQENQRFREGVRVFRACSPS